MFVSLLLLFVLLVLFTVNRLVCSLYVFAGYCCDGYLLCGWLVWFMVLWCLFC